MKKIKVGIVGYGNLGRGAEIAINASDDMELVGIFTRRNPNSIKTVYNSPVFSQDECLSFKDKIDVLVLCGGSANDLMTQSPEFVERFNIVDSFDTHAKVLEHYKNVDNVAKKSGKIGIISTGWDPGLFSLNRLLMESILNDGKTYTFWGKGISQGHSDAVRRVKGVKDAKQYTIPSSKILDEVRSGNFKEHTTREKHVRECFVVLENDTESERKRVESEIVNMPNYFADYDTTVNFITQEELDKNHSGLPHGGHVFRGGKTGIKESENNQIIEFALTLGSNPEFTASVLVAYARAAARLNKMGESGAKTIFEVPPYLTSKESLEMVIKNLL
ncbi:MAG: diaminopimelate dehydrogenase [Campylobacteraceae bacterium]|nr:diaminopimelate dehydrogenase [Campylobacteraceae bacterium]